MPELSNIQTYEKLLGTEFQSPLHRFALVLQRLGIYNQEVERALTNLAWQQDSHGFVYFSITHLGFFQSALFTIPVQPLVSVYTPAVDSSFVDNWMCFGLLLNTDEIRSATNGFYHDYVFEQVKYLAAEMRQEFKQTGVYFTNELQDGEDFDGVRCGNRKQLWRFDYALLPMQLHDLYGQPPATHQTRIHADHIEAWDSRYWELGTSVSLSR